jgi:hypothetical protein
MMERERAEALADIAGIVRTHERLRYGPQDDF